MLANFAIEICGCRPTWNVEGQLDEQLERIRERVGDQAVFLLASGGVDSTVAAALIGRALGPGRLHLLHIDNGLMRKDESASVLELFARLGLDQNLHFKDASEAFLSALDGVVEPERKRRIIGDTFVEVFQVEARRLGIEQHLLGQGTIYPDTIETGGTRRADTIKTHHNRVPVIEQLIAQGKVIEPLAQLYKVEVRELGERLGIPGEALGRHPFPGPGLGVRVLCGSGEGDEVGADVAERLDAVVGPFGLDALPLPIRSVGVKADLRCYEHPVLLSGEASWSDLVEATARVTAQVPGINRCVWNLGDQAPRHARALAATVKRERLDLLRKADALVMAALSRHGIYDDIWQCPTVLIPLELEGGEGELVVVRPVHSERAMTATAAELPRVAIQDLRDDILALRGVSGLALDVTSKPPGTIEWE